MKTGLSVNAFLSAASAVELAGGVKGGLGLSQEAKAGEIGRRAQSLAISTPRRRGRKLAKAPKGHKSSTGNEKSQIWDLSDAKIWIRAG